jgi:hypothetical protein
MSQKLNTAITVAGIDIGKNSFHVVGLDKHGAIALRQKWSRGQMEARFANMRHGDHIAIESSSSLLNLADVKFAQPPEIPDTSFRILMAYRQAGLFVTFLRDTNPAGFARMMNAILDGRPFAEAVTTGYETDLQALWLHLVQTTPTPR